MMARVLNTKNNSVLVEKLERADSFFSRFLGLMGRRTLNPGEGLWISGSGNSIHTFFMRFDIDLAYVDRDGVVRHTVNTMRPWRLSIAPVATLTDCLELPAGTLARTHTVIGDKLHVEA